jgi:orotidine-5'-phosphate decarboxylase
MMPRSFIDQLRQAQEKNKSWLCIGLDPVLGRLPDVVRAAERPMAAFCRAVVDATADLVCAYKPNLAFWLAEGVEGLKSLHYTLTSIPNDIPVILDAKFGDVGHTAKALARAAYDQLGADAVTTNPYLGLDALLPFLERADRGIFLLTRTSNPSAPDLQDLRTEAGQTVFETVARLAEGWNGDLPGTCGLVVGATYPEELASVRQLAPGLPFLIPGIGAQGGSLEAAVASGPTREGIGPVINSSRGILYASSSADYAIAARSAAQGLRSRINAVRGVNE